MLVVGARFVSSRATLSTLAQPLKNSPDRRKNAIPFLRHCQFRFTGEKYVAANPTVQRELAASNGVLVSPTCQSADRSHPSDNRNINISIPLAVRFPGVARKPRQLESQDRRAPTLIGIPQSTFLLA